MRHIDNKMVEMVGGPAIASAVFIAGQYNASVSLRHFLRGSVSSFYGLQFGSTMGVGCSEHLTIRKKMSMADI